MAPTTGPAPGHAAPKVSATARLLTPAVRPLTIAIQEASASATLRVRLLSSAQPRQAPNTAAAGQRLANSTRPVVGQLRITAPTAMASMPKAMRRSKDSLKTNQASKVVKTPSALSSNAAPEAGIAASPVISNTGAIIPPQTIAPPSQRHSPGAREPAAGRPSRRSSHRPIPEPRYNSAASRAGLDCSSMRLASGVLAPNSTAAASAARMPGLMG